MAYDNPRHHRSGGPFLLLGDRSVTMAVTYSCFISFLQPCCPTFRSLCFLKVWGSEAISSLAGFLLFLISYCWYFITKDCEKWLSSSHWSLLGPHRYHRTRYNVHWPSHRLSSDQLATDFGARSQLCRAVDWLHFCFSTRTVFFYEACGEYSSANVAWAHDLALFGCGSALCCRLLGAILLTCILLLLTSRCC